MNATMWFGAGVVSAYAVWRIDCRVAAGLGRDPLSEKVGRWRYTRHVRRVRAVVGRLTAWRAKMLPITRVPGVERVLATRHVSVVWRCQSHYYGLGTPGNPAGFRYIAGSSDHWTRLGADWTRRFGRSRHGYPTLSSPVWSEIVDNRKPFRAWPDTEPEPLVDVLARGTDHQ